ncbi:prepilin-type N-terminal cleavage/methylation domain-containing protein [Kiritimatiellota bacterium B12222]|nr:prepilin-type N-terminal cleavage/methylation domain-containing protein [Kiritimatiellota bacterium B12222]
MKSPYPQIKNEDVNARKGFTLIEMLVVIAIISFLVSMISVAVKKGMATGKSTACRSNIQQMLRAVSLYNIDNQGDFPSMKSNAYGDTWQIQLEKYLGFEANPQLSTPRVFQCPAQRWKSPENYNSVLKGDYGINRRLVNIFETTDYLKISDIQHPMSTILIADETGSWQRDIYYYDFDDPTESQRWRHSDGINFGFVDGHVKWMNFDTFKRLGYLVPDNWRYGWRDGLIY